MTNALALLSSRSCSCPGVRLFLLPVLGTWACLAAGNAQAQTTKRTKAEVEALIAKEGKSAPAWWDSVQVNYPNSLDLDWPQPPQGPWNAQKNVGQYVWDVINPNPSRWKEGVRFMHFLATKHQKDPKVFRRAVNAMARMYQDLLADWARAAFWWRVTGDNPLGLAQCYWELGSKDMTAKVLNRYPSDNTRYGAVIKLWADMGEFDRALKLAKAKARTMPAAAYLVAGDACRQVGKHSEALGYYEKVLSAQGGSERPDDVKRNKQRAAASVEAIKVFDLLDLKRVPDGTYKSSSLAYAGQLEVAVTVKGHRIAGVKVTKHQEKQFYSALTDTPKQIVAKQGLKGIDAVSGATMTSEAVLNATAKALAGAMK
ncbi:MAG: FMN-binding protein [Armatimonadetes bacterium]|nr:FMN-binding protein [Armatimonadota bacterium]